MEALAAFGLAASIMQVVDFSTKVVATGNEIFQAGSTVQNAELELVALDLKSLNDRLKGFARPDPSVQGPLAKDEQALNDLADETTKIADELYTTLIGIRLDKDCDRTRSFFQAIKTATKSNKIKETKQRLQWIRDELQFRILVSIKSSVDLVALRSADGLNSFDDVTKMIVTAIIDNRQDLQIVFEEQTNTITNYLATVEKSAARRHEESLTAIQGLSARITQSPSPAVGEPVDPTSVLRNLKRLLDYEKMDDRYEKIESVYQSTFEWIYKPQHGENLPWPNFDNWLRKEAGIYWICAKAGSGKSTLMKFIYQDERTQQALEAWAGDTPLMVLSFYFWNLGTELQKSTKGLYQSLLYQALSANKDLGPVLFPDYYEPEANWKGFPNIYQLRRAYQRLVTQRAIPLQLVLLIDGLDEFEDAEESMDELAGMITSVVESPNVKAILSSRPHPVFNDAFREYPHLKLHDLTRSDITTYVNGKIRKHPRMVTLAEEFPAETSELISGIVEFASGVFLWVKLVVRSLLEGLRNYDMLSDLQLRLNELPKDLEELFQHMLSRVPPEYRKQRSELFQLLHKIHKTSHSHELRLSLTALDVFAADLSLEAIIHCTVGPLDETEIVKRTQEVEGRLRSRCAGLIELQSPVDTRDDSSPNSEKRNSNTTGPTVQYLHKSVADFLLKPEIWSGIVEGTNGSSFDPNVSLLKAMVMRVKIFNSEESFFSPGYSGIWAIIFPALYLAEDAESSTGKPQESLLDELDQAMTKHYETMISKRRPSSQSSFHHELLHGWCDTMPEDYNRPAPWHDNFLASAIRCGLKLYVTAKFDKGGKKLLEKEGRPLLDYACRPEYAYGEREHAINPAIVEILLRNGANPNEKFNGFSPWQNALYRFFPDKAERWLRILLLLLDYGADPNAFVEKNKRLSKRRRQRRRYSALYVVLQSGNEMPAYYRSPAIQELLDDVVSNLRRKKARVYVTHAYREVAGTTVWEEQVLTREEAPFLSNDDFKSMKKRKKLEWVNSRLSGLSNAFRRVTKNRAPSLG